ncbi:MAG TPA: hypothetical protein VES73_01305 [Lamprocystis sp. (in: g-proteobacteria)]|nr:hypothetical protein [Lamprocystis sp. (in: g-proteobacteria)]
MQFGLRGNPGRFDNLDYDNDNDNDNDNDISAFSPTDAAVA